MLERMSKVKDALAKRGVNQENSTTTIKNIEIQMGQMAKQIAQIIERQSDQFSVTNQINPKEHCNNVVIEKEEKEEKDETKGKRDEKERENKRSEEKKIKKKK